MQPVCGVLRQSFSGHVESYEGVDAARMWCAEAKIYDYQIKGMLKMQPVCGVLRQSALALYAASRSGDAARMWCAEAKPDDVDLHFNAT